MIDNPDSVHPNIDPNGDSYSINMLADGLALADAWTLADAWSFLQLCGVDEAIGDQPRDRLYVPEISPSPLKQGGSASGNSPLIPASNTASSPQSNKIAYSQSAAAHQKLGTLDAAALAATKAKDAAALGALYEAIRDFKDCALAHTASHALMGLFPETPPKVKMLWIMGAPDTQEDRSGTPLSGNQGALFKNMLAAMNVDLADIYCSYSVFWRPPGDRSPTASELQICSPFINRQIELINPDYMVILGNQAAQSLGLTITKSDQNNGKWLDYRHKPLGQPAALHGVEDISKQDRRAIPTLITHSLSTLYHTPQTKLSAWRALSSLRANLNLEGL